MNTEKDSLCLYLFALKGWKTSNTTTSSIVIIKLFLMQGMCGANDDMYSLLETAHKNKNIDKIKILESYMPCFEYIDTEPYNECLICTDPRGLKDDPYEPLYPCGHRGYCDECREKMDKKCPRCRQKILLGDYKLQ